MQKKTLTWMITLVLVAVVSVAGTTLFVGGDSKKKLVVSTTTSLYDTELLDSIEDHFEAKYPTINLYFISVGTGLGITHAERGDADMILVHAPSKELTFMEGGYGTCRKIVAYNFFAVAGPETDPANIKDLSPLQALSKIVDTGRENGTKWVSRGDDSGTHTKEKELWAAAGFDWSLIREEEWYVEAATGMGKTLQVADNFNAYTLADMGTYSKYHKDGIITLKTLVTQGEELLNVYSAIAGNRMKHPHINFVEAITFIKFLVSREGQEIIGNFAKDVYGQSLFYPAVDTLKQSTDPTIVQWIRNYAFFDGYECPPEYWNDHPELYN